jgi:hypothetical protein
VPFVAGVAVAVMNVIGVIAMADGLVSAGFAVGVLVPAVDNVAVGGAFVPVAVMTAVGVPVV